MDTLKEKSVQTKFSNEFVTSENKLIKEFAGKSFLICGATGLIASTLLDFLLFSNELLMLNMQFYAIGRSQKELSKRFAYAINNKNFHIIEADIVTCNFDASFPEIDYIIQAASPAHPVAYVQNPVEVMEANFIGTLNMLRLSKCKSARLLFISSSEVYGNCLREGGNSEDEYGVIDFLSNRACYPVGKISAETLCISFNSEYNTDALVLRPCMVYGPSISPNNTRADAQFLRKCICGQDIIMKSNGTQIRSMCYVKDAVRAILYILLYGKKGEAYNLSNENSVATIREYAEIMCNISGVSLIFDIPLENERSGYSKIQNAVVKNDKLKLLGWKPWYTLQDGISDMIGHYMSTENKRI